MFNATELEDVNGVKVLILDYPPAPLSGIQYLPKSVIEDIARRSQDLAKELNCPLCKDLKK